MRGHIDRKQTLLAAVTVVLRFYAKEFSSLLGVAVNEIHRTVVPNAAKLAGGLTGAVKHVLHVDR